MRSDDGTFVLKYDHLQVPVIHSRDTHARGGGGGSCSIKTMLDANDIKVLQAMFAEQDVRIEKKLDQKLDQKLAVFRDEILTVVRSELHRELYKVRNDIIEVINGVLPQIDGLDRRVTRLERWARIV